jgi:hypothetical protein
MQNNHLVGLDPIENQLGAMDTSANTKSLIAWHEWIGRWHFCQRLGGLTQFSEKAERTRWMIVGNKIAN